jgi:hypothetical protein
MNTSSKLNEAITALTEILFTNRSTSTSGSGTVPPRVSRHGTREQVRKDQTAIPQVAGNPQIHVNPQVDPQIPGVARHRDTYGLSGTGTLNSFNSTKNIKKSTLTGFRL